MSGNLPSFISDCSLLVQEEKAASEVMPFTWRRCILEGVVFTVWIGIIPLSYIVAELFFYFGTYYISQDVLDNLYAHGHVNISLWG